MTAIDDCLQNLSCTIQNPEICESDLSTTREYFPQPCLETLELSYLWQGVLQIVQAPFFAPDSVESCAQLCGRSTRVCRRQ